MSKDRDSGERRHDGDGAMTQVQTRFKPDRITGTKEVAEKTSPLWRNLIFMKDGRSVYGYHVFLSKEDALAAIPPSEEILRGWLASGRNVRIVRKEDKTHLFYVNEYSHAVPVQWGEPT